jgi:phosphatidylserine/phosphatidylglycerophosphate/cardiolipin synthase-like enzyme
MISPLQQLSCSDLFALAEAMQSGRIAPPFTSLALQRYCSGADAASVARELQEWADGGVGIEVLARMVKLLADEYKHLTRSSPEESVDLVLTGPEVPGTTCRDTGVVLRELFCGANQSVMVAGYAVYQGKEVFRALADRMAEIPNLEVQMFLDVQRRYGDSTEPLELLRQFVHRFKTQDWPGTVMPQIYYDPRSLEMDKDKRSSLHAKCVVVDSRIAFVSSANFTEAAQVRNIEVGVVIRSEHMAKKLAGHFQALADAGVLKRL